VCIDYYSDEQLTSVDDCSMQPAVDRRPSTSSSSSSLDSDDDDVMITSAWRDFVDLSSDSEDEIEGKDVLDGVDGGERELDAEPARKRYYKNNNAFYMPILGLTLKIYLMICLCKHCIGAFIHCTKWWILMGALYWHLWSSPSPRPSVAAARPCSVTWPGCQTTSELTRHSNSKWLNCQVNLSLG